MNDAGTPPTGGQIDEALATLEAAAGSLTSASWAEHADAVPRSVEALSKLYLYTDAKGVTHETEIVSDPELTPLAMIPAAMQPLVDLWHKQVMKLVAWKATGAQVPPSSAIAIKRMAQRAEHYNRALALAIAVDPNAPNEQFFRDVSRPLLQGLYTPDFKAMGIVNPARPSKPDLTSPATETFVIALNDELVSSTQEWLIEWDERIVNFKHAMQAVLTGVAEKATYSIKRLIRTTVLVVGVVVLLIAATAWRQQFIIKRALKESPE